MATQKLFQPIKIGDIQLSHRIVHAPTTRLRAAETGVPLLPIVKDYYSQRAEVPGSFIITEASEISAGAGGILVSGTTSKSGPGSRLVVEAVHAKGSHIFLQIWASGREAHDEYLDATGKEYAAASDIPLSGRNRTPRPLTIGEIRQHVQWFATAALNAIEKAGFDGVEIHSANGYLLDTFIQDVSNNRKDSYGGSIENRTRFVLEILEAVVAKVGAKRTAIRFSPWGRFQDMRMEDPIPTFTYLVSQIKERYPDLSYLHVVEPRVSGDDDETLGIGKDSNDFLRKIWYPKSLISAGGYTRETALLAAEKGDLVAFGRLFTSNPDLRTRLEDNIELTPYKRANFYVPNDDTGVGYSDYQPAARG
ncbi:hypothetical protein C8J56DRAFT_1111964 [Mycena floridula]|nr:hypothetical protein C8J56DRAFT_1111964 [Mycena floridula]